MKPIRIWTPGPYSIYNSTLTESSLKEIIPHNFGLGFPKSIFLYPFEPEVAAENLAAEHGY